MSGIIHIQQQPSALRVGLIAAAVLVALGLAAQALGVFEPSSGTPNETAAAPVVVAASERAEALRAFPSVRVKLLEVSPAAGAAASARLEVEGRSGRFSVGQETFPGVVLRRVALDHVVLAYGELTRTVLLSAPSAVSQQAAAGDEPVPDRNKDVDVRRLTFTRFNSADSFLREVELAPHPRGGFVVRSVVPESLYDKAGLRVGDVLYSLDTDKTAKIDDRSMEAVISQTHYELDVYRNAQLVPLRYRFPTSDPEPAGAAQPAADTNAAGDAGGR